MLRSLFVVLLTVMASACATDGNDIPQCDGASEGPVDMIFSYDTFYPTSLKCLQNHTREYCTGECCHPMPIMLTPDPIDCVGSCIGLDEATCTANAACYVARDNEKFNAGMNSFIGCYEIQGYSPAAADCAMRSDAYSCDDDGMCEGLYALNATGPVFLKCVAKTATMP